MIGEPAPRLGFAHQLTAALVIVELDGSQHVEQMDYDARRSAWFESIGYRVVRIWNADFLKDPVSAREAIWAALTHDDGRAR